MNPLLALIVVIGILSSIANKKRKEEMKRKAQQQPPNSPQQSPSGQTVPMSRSTAANRQARPAPAAPQNKKPAPAVDSKWPWPTAAEKAQTKPRPAAAKDYSGTPRYTHVVQSTLEGGHTHTESSMTGEETCPPPKAAARKPEPAPVPAANARGLLSFETNSVLQGILYAEILGKPKALQGK